MERGRGEVSFAPSASGVTPSKLEHLEIRGRGCPGVAKQGPGRASGTDFCPNPSLETQIREGR